MGIRVALVEFLLSAVVLMLLLTNQFNQTSSVGIETRLSEHCSGNVTYLMKLPGYCDLSSVSYCEDHQELLLHYVIARSEMFCVPLCWMCCKSGKYYFLPNSSSGRKRVFVALLLFMSGIEPNPEPAVLKSNLGLINARFIANKTALLYDLIKDFKIDILAVTETWVYENSPAVN